jgi:hypothetical protein
VDVSNAFQVIENEVLGSSYYGIQVSGEEGQKTRDRSAKGNLIKDNDMSDLTLSGSDDYSRKHRDGIVFTNSLEENVASHIWLNYYSQGNTVEAHLDDIILDEGKDNQVMYHEFKLAEKMEFKHPLKYE